MSGCPDCHSTPWGDTACIADRSGKPWIYGPCGDERCGGVCEAYYRCDCKCHQEAKQ